MTEVFRKLKLEKVCRPAIKGTWKSLQDKKLKREVEEKTEGILGRPSPY